jgi:hypothetical protein
VTDTNTPQPDQPAVLVQVEVTNGLTDPIEDMFDGVPVIFRPGVPQVIGPEAAMHFFGYPGEPRDMAIHMAKRFGWATPANLQWTAHKTPVYVDMAAKIKFEPIYYELVRRKPDDPIPAIVPDEEPLPPPPSEATTTVVGKSRRYANASRAKRQQAEKPKGKGRGRTPHINVTEA